MGYPDQVSKIRNMQLAAAEFSDARAYRMKQAEGYTRLRFRFAAPDPAGSLEQAILAWVIDGGQRPW